jgi:ATP-binding protein involved in chromosome partitioning
VEERRKEMEEQDRLIRLRMGKIKHKLAILSGKGGVGKSTVTANLAIAFARRGRKVGVLDADIHGPSMPKILGIRGQKLVVGQIEGLGIFPATGPLGIKVISMDFLLPEDKTPVIWRGPMKMGAINSWQMWPGETWTSYL